MGYDCCPSDGQPLLTLLTTEAAYPTTLSAAFGLYALAVPSEQLADRLSVLLSLFLTVYAIQWVSGDRMPKTAKVNKW